MHKNDDIILKIEDLTTSGSGIGHYADMAVFVGGALPGETVRAHILKVKSRYAVGKLSEILEESPLRLTPRCNVFGICGGCTLQDLAYAGQLSWKHDHVESCLARIGGIDREVPYPLPSLHDWRYRNKAAFALEVKDEKERVGFYRMHSHQVVDVDNCRIQHDYVRHIISQLRVWMEKSGVSVYNEETHEGLLRRIVLRSTSKGEFMVVLVINGDDIPDRRRLLQLFKLALPRVTSIVLNVNTQASNVILGEKNIPVYGPGFLMETICALHFRIGPNSFMQVNHQQMEAMYMYLLRELAVRPTETVLDLYCGIGTITLLAAQRAKAVTGIEIVEEAVENARFNALTNQIENAEFFAADAAEWIRHLKDQEKTPDVIITDPPRKGLHEDVIDAAAAARPRIIGYISCDPATLARDIRRFGELGYTLQTIQPFDLFPQTTHTETVVTLVPDRN